MTSQEIKQKLNIKPRPSLLNEYKMGDRYELDNLTIESQLGNSSVFFLECLNASNELPEIKLEIKSEKL